MSNIGFFKPDKKRGRKLKMTVKTRKDSAWKAMSLYIRMKATKDYKNIFIPCYTCGKIHHYKEMDAGHGIGSRSNAVLFVEEIIKPQCTHCNKYLSGNYKVFTEKLIEELGVEKYSEILKRKSETIKYSPQDYLDIQRKYEEKLKV